MHEQCRDQSYLIYIINLFKSRIADVKSSIKIKSSIHKRMVLMSQKRKNRKLLTLHFRNAMKMMMYNYLQYKYLILIKSFID